MSKAPRVLGIIAGLLAGTIAALFFRGIMATTNNVKTSHAEKNVISVEDDDDIETTRPQAPDPGRRRRFHIFDQIGNRHRPRQLAEAMQMIFDAIDDQRRALDLVECPDQIAIEFFANGRRFQKRLAIFRGEHHMD